jgi:hypothetical protein
MLAFGVVVVLGFFIGLVRGGRLRHITTDRIALMPLAWTAAGMQIAAQLVPRTWTVVAYGLVVISFAALFAFAGANWRVPGMMLVAIGALLNYAVILANQGMPISEEAAARAGFVGAETERLVLRGKHFVAAQSEITWPALGDVIPLWRQPAVASAGDLIIWAGLIVVVQSLMQPRRRASRRAKPRRTRERRAPRVIDLRDEREPVRRGSRLT